MQQQQEEQQQQMMMQTMQDAAPSVAKEMVKGTYTGTQGQQPEMQEEQNGRKKSKRTRT